MDKSETLARWRGLADDQNPLVFMEPIPYRAGGSKYGTCGVRIDGSPQFVDSVLSRLKPLLDGENQVTRLELSRHEVKATEINGERKTFDNSRTGAEVCYIRLHMRGGEAVAMNAMFDKAARPATDRFAAVNVFVR